MNKSKSRVKTKTKKSSTPTKSEAQLKLEAAVTRLRQEAAVLVLVDHMLRAEAARVMLASPRQTLEVFLDRAKQAWAAVAKEREAQFRALAAGTLRYDVEGGEYRVAK